MDFDFDTDRVIEITNSIAVVSGVFFSLLFGIGGFLLDASLFEGSVLFFFGLFGGYAAVWIFLIGIFFVIAIASIIVGKILGYIIFLAIASGLYLLYFLFSIIFG
ncbi:hypothetical protein [Marinobacter sp. SS5-14b]|uniref:hypothetical protein n=1 Tax=Marinobacter sp. SS5-14b TaxID=3050456 RepID=UPI0026E00E36|nr:hypothetical protein [Marinobacter sp. SS5-14b]